MIKKIELYRFKRFKRQSFNLKSDGITVLAGGNNSGKSSILHALAVWEFCKTILILEKTKKCLIPNSNTQGFGLSADEFLPIALPSLKHLWTNLKFHKDGEQDGYTLKIKCTWDLPEKSDCFLEFGLSLVNDRLFIKSTDSNLTADDYIPSIAYLPTFAGITDKENRMSGADRRRQIGKGLTGSVLRNMLLDMANLNRITRKELKGDRSKIRTTDLERLRQNDSWELLQKTLREIFMCELEVSPFNDLYHSYIRVELYKGQFVNNRFIKHPDYTNRDIMVEGSGFLQWLSVYSLALDKDIDVLLLDEPDAHLHSSLQFTLLERLTELTKTKNKQVLIATHSTEILKNVPVETIFEFRNNRARYLTDDSQKTGLLAGLGCEYSPRLNQIQIHKKMFIVENESDANFLKIWSRILGLTWPENVIIWPWASGHKERKYLFLELKREIPTLKAISLRDRDEEHYNTVDSSLKDLNFPDESDGMIKMKWRRRHIENYLMSPSAIARAVNSNEEEIKVFFAQQHSLVINGDFVNTDVAPALYDAWGKEIISTGIESVEKRYNCNKQDIASAMSADEVCEDVKTLIDKIMYISTAS